LVALLHLPHYRHEDDGHASYVLVQPLRRFLLQVVLDDDDTLADNDLGGYYGLLLPLISTFVFLCTVADVFHSK